MFLSGTSFLDILTVSHFDCFFGSLLAGSILREFKAHNYSILSSLKPKFDKALIKELQKSSLSKLNQDHSINLIKTFILGIMITVETKSKSKKKDDNLCASYPKITGSEQKKLDDLRIAIYKRAEFLSFCNAVYDMSALFDKTSQIEGENIVELPKRPAAVVEERLKEMKETHVKNLRSLHRSISAAATSVI